MTEQEKPPCLKFRHKSELDAKIALARRFYLDKGEIRHYYCYPCRAWHLTSKEKRS